MGQDEGRKPMSFVSSRLGGDQCRGNVQRNIRNKNVFPECIMAHCIPENRDDQGGGMLVYNHEAKSAHVSQRMEVRCGKQAGSGGPESRQGAGRVLH